MATRGPTRIYQYTTKNFSSFCDERKTFSTIKKFSKYYQHDFAQHH